MIKAIIAAFEHDTAVIPIAKTWVLGLISLWVGMSEMHTLIQMLVATTVIIYTSLKSVGVYEDNKEKRKQRKNGKSDSA